MNMCGAASPPTQKGKEIVACRGGEAAPARHNFSFSYGGAAPLL